MGNKPLCFIISPIGEAGSQTRKNADYLLDLIIRPALEGFDLEIMRGDHCHTPNQIHEHVVQCIRDAALCIADISAPNINVYYEVGRRDETGKPMILLRRSDAGVLPVDLGTRRYVHYSLDAEGITNARRDLRLSVQDLARAGFEAPKSQTQDMEQMMLQLEQRLLQKLDPHLQPEKPKASVFGGLLPKSPKKPAKKPAAKPAAPAKTSVSAPKPAVPAAPAPAAPKREYSRTELDRLFRDACEKRDVETIDELLDYIETTPLAESPAFLNSYVIAAWKSGSKKAFSLVLKHASSGNS